MSSSTSTYTVSSLPRISAIELSELLLAAAAAAASSSSTSSEPQSQSESQSQPQPQPTPSSKIAIIDVRDDDHIGGHIASSTHVPSSTLDYAMPSLVRTLKDKEVVVFHCALSQQRGPAAALRYLRERDRLLGGATVGEKMMKSAAEQKGLQLDNETPQQVLLLEGGFVKWQERFGSDLRLTEGWRREIWEEDY